MPYRGEPRPIQCFVTLPLLETGSAAATATPADAALHCIHRAPHRLPDRTPYASLISRFRSDTRGYASSPRPPAKRNTECVRTQAPQQKALLTRGPVSLCCGTGTGKCSCSPVATNVLTTVGQQHCFSRHCYQHQGSAAIISCSTQYNALCAVP